MGAIKYTAEETSLEVTTCRRTVCTGRQGRYLATNIGGGGGGGGPWELVTLRKSQVRKTGTIRLEPVLNIHTYFTPTVTPNAPHILR